MATAVWIIIDKFGPEPVLIDPDHPLAVAQVKRDAERLEQKKEPTLPPELKPVVEALKESVSLPPVVPSVTPPAPVRPAPTKSKKKR